MLQPPALLAFCLRFGYIGQKHHTPRDPDSGCSWGTLAVWGQVHRHEELAITGWCLPHPAILWFAVGTSECTQGTEVASVHASALQSWAPVEVRQWIRWEVFCPSLLCVQICTLFVHYEGKRAAEETLTLGSLKEQAFSRLPLLCFTSRPHQKVSDWRENTRLNVELGDGIFTLTQFGNKERTIVQYIIKH